MPEPLPTLNHYEVLGLARNASLADIRAAYLRLVKIYHPDRADFSRRKASIQIFQMITAAYATLGRPDNRRVYDATLPPEEVETAPMANDNIGSEGFWGRLFK